MPDLPSPARPSRLITDGSLHRWIIEVDADSTFAAQAAQACQLVAVERAPGPVRDVMRQLAAALAHADTLAAHNGLHDSVRTAGQPG